MTELPDLYGYDSSYRIWETFRLCRAYALVPHLRGLRYRLAPVLQAQGDTPPVALDTFKDDEVLSRPILI